MPARAALRRSLRNLCRVVPAQAGTGSLLTQKLDFRPLWQGASPAPRRQPTDPRPRVRHPA